MNKALLSFLYSIVVSCALLSSTFAADFLREPESEYGFSVSTIDFQSNTAPREFYESLKNTGFALITNHGIDYATMQQKLREFFALSDTEKDRFHNRHHPITRLGWYPLGVENAAGSKVPNQMEYIHYAPNHVVFEGELNDAIGPYFQGMFEIAKTLTGWLDQMLPSGISLSDDRSLAEMITNEQYTIMRGLRYPACVPSNEDVEINVRHTDISFLSLLFATSTGLQAQDNYGNWHDVGGTSETLVINAGDMLQWVTKYHIKSTWHRVIKKAAQSGEPIELGEDRISMPVFVGIYGDIILPSGSTVKEAFEQRMRENGVAIVEK